MFSATRLSATKAGADAAQTAAERDAACKAAARQRRLDAEAAARAHREEERRRAAREPPPAFVAKYEARIAANRCMAARLDASRRELHVAGRALKGRPGRRAERGAAVDPRDRGGHGQRVGGVTHVCGVVEICPE